MCGIAGMFDLTGERMAPIGVVPAMARAIVPSRDRMRTDSSNDLVSASASRRLSLSVSRDGKQPIANEDRTVWTVFNGELFNYAEKRPQVEGKGHVFRTHTDTELLPHLWEEHREKMFDHIKGQFAFCLWDSRSNEVVLARDRAGICPLFYTVVKRDGTNWLLFASEMKALFASGLVERKADIQGLNHIFTFMAMPGPATVFAGIKCLTPGRYLHFKLGSGLTPETATAQRIYWQVTYPDRGQEDYGSTRRRSSTASRRCSSAPQRQPVATPTCLSCPTFREESIRASSSRWRTRRSAARSRRSRSR